MCSDFGFHTLFSDVGFHGYLHSLFSVFGFQMLVVSVCFHMSCSHVGLQLPFSDLGFQISFS